MGKIAVICALATILSVLNVGLAQNQTVTYCPLYLVLQNRCPTPSTTSTTTSTRRPSQSGESDVVTECSQPTLTFCPAMELFLTGGRNCSEGQTIQVSFTTLGELLVSPSGENAAATVGQPFVDQLGKIFANPDYGHKSRNHSSQVTWELSRDTFASISKTIQAQPTQATIGVTFVPVGQIVG